ncbi:MAG: hemerythrin domain-containing protein [Myxococcales bacterium]|nr:hemerythrin domain-containing protein [Myxococcales bacterium]
MEELRSCFRDDHARLAVLLDQLGGARAPGDELGLLALWALFERSVRAHIQLEESALLPALEQTHPTECRRARYEHDRIRDSISDLAALAKSGGLLRQALDQLESDLLMHSSWEDTTLYPLAEARLAPAERERVLATLRRHAPD